MNRRVTTGRYPRSIVSGVPPACAGKIEPCIGSAGTPPPPRSRRASSGTPVLTLVRRIGQPTI